MELITMEEAAAILGRGESDVRYYVQKGMIVRYGEYKNYSYDKESVEALAVALRRKDEDLDGRKKTVLEEGRVGFSA